MKNNKKQFKKYFIILIVLVFLVDVKVWINPHIEIIQVEEIVKYSGIKYKCFGGKFDVNNIMCEPPAHIFDYAFDFDTCISISGKGKCYVFQNVSKKVLRFGR